MTANELLNKFRKEHPEHYQINGQGDHAYPGGWKAWLKLNYEENPTYGMDVRAGLQPAPLAHVPLQMTEIEYLS